MSPAEGLLFLAAGIVAFACGIAWMIARERSSRKPKRTVAHFQRSGSAMRRIFSAQVARREAARARARAAHPATRRRLSGRAGRPRSPHRRSA